jgi:hypothetical protein
MSLKATLFNYYLEISALLALFLLSHVCNTYEEVQR